MIILFLAFIFILAILLTILKKHKLALIFLSLFGIIFILNGSGFITSILLNKLQSPYISSANKIPAWQKRNIIMVLGAGAAKLPGNEIVKPGIFGYSRITIAAGLYFSCLKSGNQCLLMISGSDHSKTGISEAENYRDNLLELGVKKPDIILESNSNNTYQNALFCTKILQENQYDQKHDQLILVTSGVHLHRSLLYFSHFKIFPIPVMADYSKAYFSLIPTSYNFALSDLAMHEYIGIARFHIYNLLGLND